MIPQATKEKIFALYYGQECGWETNQKCPMQVYPSLWSDQFFVLKLKSLSEISDEDAIEVWKLSGFGNPDKEKLEKIKELLRKYGIFIFLDHYFIDSEACTEVIDYLRSKGYAIKAYGYSVEQLVNEGIFKLIGE